MPKLKGDKGGSLSKSEPQKLQRLYTQGGAVYGCVYNLLKASSLPLSKVRQFLHSKRSYTKFTLATRKFKILKSIARFKIEIWCIDLAYVDIIAKDNDAVKYLLVCHDLFHRTVDAKGMKTKDSTETVPAFLTVITKKNRSKKIRVEKKTELDEGLKRLCKAEGIQIYCIMSRTQSAFAEGKIRSLKFLLHLHIEEYGFQLIHKLTQFPTTLTFRINCSIDLIPKNLRKPDFLSILYSKQLREYRENQSLKLETQFASRSMT